MNVIWPTLLLLLASSRGLAGILIVADELPAMRSLAARIKAEEKIDSQVVVQKEMPPDLAKFDSVIVYIHGALSAPAEDAFIRYTEAGGKLLLLHHSISSGKRENARWFPFLGVKLPKAELSEGGYKWLGNVTWSLVNLAPDEFIMTNRVDYPERISFGISNSPARKLPGFTLSESEVYLNHTLDGSRKVLMGLRYADPATGQVFEQPTAGWIKKAGKGTIIYLMPGHSLRDLQNPAYERIILNAVLYRP